ncbi:MFS transporter [Natronobeatus ordinarius]|uniref:MFS transporter n=1 Tax=Natronobeatus ordinarius TaxID=2963433 RepID=UPI0020CCA9BB|nr:MFS transporter [Natronobeatus ordinarius]
MNQTAARRTTGRTAVFGSLCVMVFLVNLGRVIYAPLLEPFRTTFDASAGAVGLLATLAWIGSASLRFPTGYLLTKFPRHWIVLTTGLVLAGSSAFAATAQTLEALYVGAFLMGVASGMYYVSASPLVSELFPMRVGRAIGIHGTASQVAAVVAPLMVGAYFLVEWPISAWRVVFLTISVAALLSSAALFLSSRRATMPTAGRGDRQLLEALRRQWPLIATGVLIVGFTGLVWNGLFNFYVTYLVETKGFSEGLARTVLTVLFAAGVPAFFVAGWLADRVAFAPLLFSILGSFVACLLVLTYVESLAAVVVVSLLIGYVIHSLFPTVDTYLLASLPDENRASAYTFFSGTMMPIQATGSAIVGGLVDVGIGFDAVFQAFAVGLVAILLVLVGLSRLGRLPAGVNG